MVKVIGITGSIATGKSTVTTYLIEKGYVVLDSDQYSRECLHIDNESIEKVKATFDCVVDGQIDRKKLGQIVFHDKQAKEQLEAIIHPYVIRKLKEGIQENKNQEIVFLDIPLLYECSLEYLCDTILVVYCDPDVQLERLQKRDQITKTYAKQIISNQMSIIEKKKRADIVVDNSGTKTELLEQLEQLW